MSAPSLPLVLGSFGLNECPGFNERADATKTSIKRVYNGTYSQAQAGAPTVGDTYSDLPGDVIVVGTLVEKLPGQKGMLTVDLETPYETTYECEWVEIDEDLMKNPRYWCEAAGDPADGPKLLTPQDRAMLDRWDHEEDAVLRMHYLFKVAQNDTTTIATLGYANPVAYPLTAEGFGGASVTITPTATAPTIGNIPYNIYQLSTNAQDYALKRLRGTEAYRLYAPVVRETSESFDPPVSNQCGVLENPPVEAGELVPAGYVWQRSAQRVVRTGPYGKYRLQREWQGAWTIDDDLYQESTTGYSP